MSADETATDTIVTDEHTSADETATDTIVTDEHTSADYPAETPLRAFPEYRLAGPGKLSMDFGVAECPPGLTAAFAKLDRWAVDPEIDPNTAEDLRMDVEKHLRRQDALQQEAYASGAPMEAFKVEDLETDA